MFVRIYRQKKDRRSGQRLGRLIVQLVNKVMRFSPTFGVFIIRLRHVRNTPITALRFRIVSTEYMRLNRFHFLTAKQFRQAVLCGREVSLRVLAKRLRLYNRR